MIKQICLLLLFLVAFAEASTAQVSISEEENVNTLIRRRAGSRPETVTGWSVQIIATDDRVKAEDVKVRFLSQFPDVIGKVDFVAPYYRVRVGAFMTKHEATQLMNLVTGMYPEAYVIINDMISPRDL